jgi:hypothetical protein
MCSKYPRALTFESFFLRTNQMTIQTKDRSTKDVADWEEVLAAGLPVSLSLSLSLSLSCFPLLSLLSLSLSPPCLIVDLFWRACTCAWPRAQAVDCHVFDVDHEQTVSDR